MWSSELQTVFHKGRLIRLWRDEKLVRHNSCSLLCNYITIVAQKYFFASWESVLVLKCVQSLCMNLSWSLTKAKREKNIINKKKIWPTWQSAGTEFLYFQVKMIDVVWCGLSLTAVAWPTSAPSEGSKSWFTLAIGSTVLWSKCSWKHMEIKKGIN